MACLHTQWFLYCNTALLPQCYKTHLKYRITALSLWTGVMLVSTWWSFPTRVPTRFDSVDWFRYISRKACLLCYLTEWWRKQTNLFLFLGYLSDGGYLPTPGFFWRDWQRRRVFFPVGLECCGCSICSFSPPLRSHHRRVTSVT